MRALIGFLWRCAHEPEDLDAGSVGPSTLAGLNGFLLINPRSGSGKPGTDELRATAEERGLETHVLAEGDDAARILRAARTDALGVAGGDGSLAAGASVAIERDLPFAVVPFGTRNHFARDVGVDRADPIAALDAFSGREQRVDVGRVDGRLFLNNVSFGIYAELVHRREHGRRRRAALARARALWLTAIDRSPLRLSIDGAPVEAQVVLVANNAYELDLFNVGERDSV